MKKRAYEPKTQSGAARPKRGIASVHGILYRTLTLRFLDAEVEKKFEEHHYHQNWRHIRLAVLLSILVFVLFGAVDYILLPDEYLRVWGIRLLAYVPFSILILILTYTKQWRLAFTAGPFAMLIAGVSLIVPISGNPLHGSPEYFVAMLLFLLFGYALLRVRYVWMVRAGLIMTLSYELVLLYLSPVDVETFLVSTLFLIAANSIGMTAAYAIERFARRDFVQTMLLVDSADNLALSISYRDQHVKQFIAAATDAVLFRFSGDLQTKQVSVVEHSQALLEMLGVVEDQSKDLAQWFIHAEKPAEVAKELSKTVLDGGHYRSDITVVLPEKGKRSLQLLVVAAEDVFDNRRSALGILIDLTDERQQQERQAMLLNQKTKFLEITGHQLNTPLNMMKWGLEALVDAGGNKEKSDQVMRGMSQATGRMTRVLHDVFSALALSEHPPLVSAAPTDGGLIFEAVRKRFGEVRRLKLPSQRQLAGINLVADTEKLAFVIERLVENALDYSERGDVVVEAVVTGDRLVVRVEDNGIGVPPSERPFIFQLFYRGEQATTMQPNRSGISLHLAKAYVEAHAGRLRLDTSVPGVTAFVFEVPLAPSHK